MGSYVWVSSLQLLVFKQWSSLPVLSIHLEIPVNKLIVFLLLIGC